MADIDRKNHEVESAQGDAKTKRPRTSPRTPPPPPPPRSSPTFCLPGRCGTWARRSSRRTRRTRTGLVFRVRVADTFVEPKGLCLGLGLPTTTTLGKRDYRNCSTVSSLADAKVAEYDVQELLDVDGARDASERARRQPQLLRRDLVPPRLRRRLRGERAEVVHALAQPRAVARARDGGGPPPSPATSPARASTAARSTSRASARPVAHDTRAVGIPISRRAAAAGASRRPLLRTSRAF